MRRLFALAALLCAAPSPAIETPKWTDATPPKRFQATGFVPVIFVPAAEIYASCGPVVGAPPPGVRIIACTRYVETPQGAVRVVVMPDPCEAAGWDWFAQIQCHENSHYLKNWKHEE